MGDVTRIHADIERGDRQAAGELLPLVYDELRKLAGSRLAREASGQTLQPTALVHEAYLRLVGGDPGKAFDGRGYFFAAAAEAMRRILVDRVRRRLSRRHRWGFSWQITPRVLLEAMTDPDRDAAKRAMEAMMTMRKIDIATIEAARRGEGR
jgi:RNA polymerase sigma factor (TIGR02999 family)